MTAASAAYLNNRLQPTASSVRSCLAPASGGGLPLALGTQEADGEEVMPYERASLV